MLRKGTHLLKFGFPACFTLGEVLSRGFCGTAGVAKCLRRFPLWGDGEVHCAVLLSWDSFCPKKKNFCTQVCIFEITVTRKRKKKMCVLSWAREKTKKEFYGEYLGDVKTSPPLFFFFLSLGKSF